MQRRDLTVPDSRRVDGDSPTSVHCPKLALAGSYYCQYHDDIVNIFVIIAHPIDWYSFDRLTKDNWPGRCARSPVPWCPTELELYNTFTKIATPTHDSLFPPNLVLSAFSQSSPKVAN